MSRLRLCLASLSRVLSRVQYGCPRLWVLLRREAWLINKNLVYGLYLWDNGRFRDSSV